MSRALLAALALTLLAGCADDELDRANDDVGVSPMPAAVGVDLEDAPDSAVDDDVSEPFVDPDAIYDTTPLETEDVESTPVPEVGLEENATTEESEMR